MIMDDKELHAIAEGFNEEFMRTVSALVRGEGFLSMIRHRAVAHLAGGRVANDRGQEEEPGDGLIPVTATMQLPFEALEAGDADRLIETLVGAAKEMKSEMTRRTFARMDEIAEEHGMTVDARGRPFSADLFVEMLEKIDIEFDESGKAIMPSVVVHPSNMEKLRAALDTDDAKERIAAVIAKKKKAKGL